MDLLSKFLNNWTNGRVQKSTWLKFLVVITLPSIATIALFVIGFMEGADGTMPTSKVIHNTMFWVFVPSILVSLFLAQQLGLVGDFGESILLLIPTFIWLLPGSPEATWNMIVLAMWMLGIGMGFFIVGLSLKLFINKNEDTYNATMRKVMPLLLRVTFITIAVVGTLIISVILIHWAKFGNMWLYAKDANGDWITEIDGSLTEFATGTPWVGFISVVTLIVATILVLLGLLKGFTDALEEQKRATPIRAFINMFRNNSTAKEQKRVSARKKTEMIAPSSFTMSTGPNGPSNPDDKKGTGV